MIKLSVLDQAPIAEGSNAFEAISQTVQLAQEVEKMGYRRFWVAEHHFTTSLASSTPEVLISYIGAKTKRIRIGSGGIMLPHYSSYKVAENFRMLEVLHPNRIDLGIGRAPGGMPLATRALQEGKFEQVDCYSRQVKDVIDYLHDSIDENHRFGGLYATPKSETVPEVWLLGSSGGSAKLAAELGAGLTFAQFINGNGGSHVIEQYKKNFKPSILNKEPQTMVAIFVICANTNEEAERLAKSLDLTLLHLEKGRGRNKGIPSVHDAEQFQYEWFDHEVIRENRKRMIIGDQASVKEQIIKLSEQYGANEVMVVTITHDFQAKLKSFQLIADAFN